MDEWTDGQTYGRPTWNHNTRHYREKIWADFMDANADLDIGGNMYEGPAKSFVTGFTLLQCYIFLLQTFKVFPLYWNTFL